MGVKSWALEQMNNLEDRLEKEEQRQDDWEYRVFCNGRENKKNIIIKKPTKEGLLS